MPVRISFGRQGEGQAGGAEQEGRRLLLLLWGVLSSPKLPEPHNLFHFSRIGVTKGWLMDTPLTAKGL